VCVREIRWSEESEDHIWARHQVTPAEVEQTVHTRPRLTKAGREGVELVYGTTDAGRYLLVSSPTRLTAATTSSPPATWTPPSAAISPAKHDDPPHTREAHYESPGASEDS